MRRTVALAGNPNVGKSTVFNALTGSRQHTGNWSGKTVACAERRLRGGGLTLTDLPGTYSLRAHSEEERAAREFLVSGQACAVVLVADAGCLERSLILALQVLEVQKNAILCLNLMDEAAKKGIEIDVDALERELGIPVIPCAARQGKGLHELEAAIRRAAAGENETHPTAIRYPAMDEDLTEEQRDDIATAAAALRAEEIALTCVRQPECACARDDRADDVILSRRFGVPLMLLLLAGVFYITLFGANVPSEWLSTHLLALSTPLAGALAKLGLPPFILGLSWSTTERMSQQQSEILASELESYRALLTPVILRICRYHLEQTGLGGKVQVKWKHISIADEVEQARAKLLDMQAKEIEAKINQRDRQQEGEQDEV